MVTRWRRRLASFPGLEARLLTNTTPTVSSTATATYGISSGDVVYHIPRNTRENLIRGVLVTISTRLRIMYAAHLEEIYIPPLA